MVTRSRLRKNSGRKKSTRLKKIKKSYIELNILGVSQSHWRVLVDVLDGNNWSYELVEEKNKDGYIRINIMDIGERNVKNLEDMLNRMNWNYVKVEKE